MTKSFGSWALLLGMVAWPLRSYGDAGHEVNIEQLNGQIAQTPEQADLYYARADNFRELAKLPEARADLEKCLLLAPHFLPASRELARMDEREQRLDAAISRLSEAIKNAPGEAAFHLPSCYAVLSGFYLKAGKPAEALKAAEQGISAGKDFSIDIHLARSEAQRQLGLHAERIRDLEATHDKTRAYVIRLAWIEALLDGQQARQALPEIEREIDSSRLKSSWLIRRARALMQLGKEVEAKADLLSARVEIDVRLRPELPDVTLLCDLATIEALEGNRRAAEAHLAAVRSRNVDESIMRIPMAIIQALPAAPPQGP